MAAIGMGLNHECCCHSNHYKTWKASKLARTNLNKKPKKKKGNGLLTIFSKTQDWQACIPSFHWAPTQKLLCYKSNYKTIKLTQSLIVNQNPLTQISKTNSLLSYIETTDEPSQVIPFHDSTHGSPPLLVQPVSCEGLFSDVYTTWRAWTAICKTNDF